MKTNRLVYVAALASQLTSGLLAQPTLPLANRAPLAPLRYLEMPLGAIRPDGWLRHQLTIMREGTTGHLDEYYPKLRDDNGWLGGKGDGWEETPYWLDGAVPLAYLLNDKPLIDKVRRYIDWSLTTQRLNGYFGPLTKDERAGKSLTNCSEGEDWWPRMVMLKVMQQHYQATGDARVIPFMTRYFRYQYANLKTCPLGKWTEWSQARGGDNMMIAYWLYNLTGDKFLLDLGDELNAQTMPWTQFFAERNWVMNAAARQNGDQWMSRHAVNVGMGLKLPVIYAQAHPDQLLKQTFKTGWTDLMLLHGLPHGMFSGDEDLHGNEPTQGTELCAIVETMFSLEQAIAVTGDPVYMDALERMTYNALPTQTTDDYNNRQYFQIANQVQVSRGVYDFSLPFDRGMNNVFGPYAGYTCCTANMHQGWTKFTSHLWYAAAGGVAALEYAPNTLTTKIAGTPVTIAEATNYPFDDQITLTITTPKPVRFPLELRIPGWCVQAAISVNGQTLRQDKGGQVVTLNRTWKTGDRVTLQLPMRVTTTNWAKNSRVVERGPLVYALRVKSEVTKRAIPEEGTYYQYEPASIWNVGLPKAVVDNPAETLTVTMQPMPANFVWNETSVPITITTSGRRIPNWQLIDGVARQPVSARDGIYKGEVSDKTEELTLIPYGCTKLRVVAFPVIK